MTLESHTFPSVSQPLTTHRSRMHPRLFAPFVLAALLSGCTVLALRPNSGIENRTFAVQETHGMVREWKGR